MNSATEVFVACLFLWCHLSLLHSSPLMELDIFFFPRAVGCVSVILSLDLLITVSLWLFLYL